ncbi:MAG: phospholipase A, partial [Muribaculaceae bacterium]|nr:phospholipase A [Muribaculaceae bacterium]
VGWQFQSMNRKWSSSVTLVKRSGWNLNYNIQCDVAYRFSTKSNQYLYAQYYCGYGEGLLAYKEHHSQLRIGIVIKPTLFSEY